MLRVFKPTAAPRWPATRPSTKFCAVATMFTLWRQGRCLFSFGSQQGAQTTILLFAQGCNVWSFCADVDAGGRGSERQTALCCNSRQGTVHYLLGAILTMSRGHAKSKTTSVHQALQMCNNKLVYFPSLGPSAPNERCQTTMTSNLRVLVRQNMDLSLDICLCHSDG